MRRGPSGWTVARPLRDAALANKKAAPTAVTPPRARKTILVDGNNVLYHFYNPLCSVERDGQKSGAIEGMIRLLKRFDELHRPQHICVFFDQPQQKTVRKTMDPTYKSGRRPTPRALRPQLTSVSGLLETASVNCFTCAGVEADDMIASYASALHNSGNDVLIVSNDNDFLQLTRGEHKVNDKPAEDSPGDPAAPSSCIEVYQMNKRRYLRERHIRSRFSIPPWQLPDFFALCGFNWGKLPRVPGVTDELAVELLTKYGSLHRLLRSLDEIEDPVLRKTLKHSISSIESSYRISKLVDQYALPVAVDALAAPQLELLPSP